MKYILLATTFMAISACASTPRSPSEECCQRLDARTQEMQEFNRFCKVLIFAERTNKNPAIQESIARRLGICRFVFGAENNTELLSAGPDDNLYKVQHFLDQDLPVNGWRTPLDCDPSEPTCEEF
jgi:hypothetical protein